MQADQRPAGSAVFCQRGMIGLLGHEHQPRGSVPGQVDRMGVFCPDDESTVRAQ
jgi:hypothetical protein